MRSLWYLQGNGVRREVCTCTYLFINEKYIYESVNRPLVGEVFYVVIIQE